MDYFTTVSTRALAMALLLGTAQLTPHAEVLELLDRSSGTHQNCSDGSTPHVRLLGRSGPHEGRVEVLHGSGWGTVCDDSFDRNAAQVVCNMLGFTGGVVIKYAEFYYVPTVPVMLDEVSCTGSELSIMDCSHSGWGEVDVLCSRHTEDVTVQCCGLDSLAWYCKGANPYQHAVQLTSENGPHEGILSIYHDGAWGTVNGRGFGHLEALVVCRSMGYRWGESVPGYYYGNGQGNVWLSEVVCEGTESQLVDCSHSDWLCEDCHHRDDAAVKCK